MTLADLASRIGRDIKALRDGKVDGTDSRLTDARTPTDHQHALADVDGLQAALDSAGAADLAEYLAARGA